MTKFVHRDKATVVLNGVKRPLHAPSVFSAQRARHGDWVLCMSGSTGEFCVLSADDFHARFMKEAA